MDENIDDNFEAEENYYAFLNISKSASPYIFAIVTLQFS